MSETPETEAALERALGMLTPEYVMAEKCRELEDERNEAINAIIAFCEASQWCAKVWKEQAHIKPLFDIYAKATAGKGGGACMSSGSTMNTSFLPRCDMLIDQNRYIGSDPVGHCCEYPATHIIEKTHFICERCTSLLKQGSDRITIPEVGSVAGWEERVKDAIKSMQQSIGKDPL